MKKLILSCFIWFCVSYLGISLASPPPPSQPCRCDSVMTVRHDFHNRSNVHSGYYHGSRGASSYHHGYSGRPSPVISDNRVFRTDTPSFHVLGGTPRHSSYSAPRRYMPTHTSPFYGF